ncbi:hypothetical protein [Pseudoalteromonas sp. OOF1S-7]|uniref:hypothetical protein n=1 Tax=Pseudoalteromonas sp. OOF1S-7 TaxID=2917757 RepID=UPI001EF5E6D5|nr:hypothetical protein [Pseudoalteromonas sp. OOF1S-7]MCG7536497.1 hypothetical protein [Pseudoalteromonas sp. OOF1S-7]
MSIFTFNGRTLLARSVAQTPLYLAWGRGDGNWQTPPSEPISAAQLADPLGYRKVKIQGFCEPDEQGDIEVQGARYRHCAEPTRHVYCQFIFDFEDAQGETIRELGIFSGTTFTTDVPGGQVYVSPDQVVSPGTLLLLDHRAPLVREPGVRESFEFVMSF